MPEQHPDLKPFPFCCNTIFTYSVHEDDNGFYSVSCQCGCSLSPDVQYSPDIISKWNSRVYTHDEAKVILTSSVQQSQDFDPTLLKRAIFFYWLAVALLSSFSFFNESTFREGLAGFLIIAGLFTFIYAVFNFIRSLSIEEEGQA